KAVRTRRVVREEELPRIPVGVEALLLNRLGHVEHDDVLSSVGRDAVYVSLADSVTPVVDEVANSGFVAVTGHLISPVIMQARGASRRRASGPSKKAVMVSRTDAQRARLILPTCRRSVAFSCELETVVMVTFCSGRGRCERTGFRGATQSLIQVVLLLR